MKRYLLPLAALALLAGACSSPTASSSFSAQPVAAIPAGTLKTAWGELPTYKADGDAFPFVLGAKRPWRPPELRSDDAAVLDVLVDRDGSIRDVKVHTSSGIEAVDRFAINHYVGAHSRLQVAATDPAPYVIRQTFRIQETPVASGGSVSRNDTYQYSDMRPMGTGAPYWTDKN
jgi:hypothetical protein